ncbi:MAG: secondary thiamine-phosphate synthase enzyme YjbQ [Candidatus Thermoplasmatota archaeon]|nr:secondary thiamine-phosphate synthase enzyme YjbQ [Candidatus Thermoplasmatota archaeon]
METIDIRTSSRTELVDITAKVQKAVRDSGIREGVCFVYTPHTTGAVTINENADPSVRKDITMEIDKVIPFEDGYSHSEGNAAAHIKSSLFGCSATLLVEKGDLVLGTWQGVFFCEFDGPRNRRAHVKVLPG